MTTITISSKQDPSSPECHNVTLTIDKGHNVESSYYGQFVVQNSVPRYHPVQDGRSYDADALLLLSLLSREISLSKARIHEISFAVVE